MSYAHPSPRGHRYVCDLSFKFDESYKRGRTFVVGGFLAELDDWKGMQEVIESALAFENTTLPFDKQLTRYHASQMEAKDNEFENLPLGDDRIKRLRQKMVDGIGSCRLTGISIGLDWNAHQEIFPDRGRVEIYKLCLQFALDSIGNHLDSNNAPGRVFVIQEMGDEWNEPALSAYGQIAEDKSWKHYSRFISLAPMRPTDDLGLQAADTMAYETLRCLDPLLHGQSEPTREELRSILEKSPQTFAKHFDREVLLTLKRDEEEHAAS